MLLCMTNLCLAVQEEKLKRPLSDIESWRLARVRPNPKAGESEYYGHTGENLTSYTKEFQKWNPGTSDPLSVDTDERAAVSIGPKSHGRHPILDSVITPSVSYRRIRASDPRPNQRPRPSASSTLSLVAQQNSVSIFPLIFFLSTFIFRIAMFYEFHHVIFVGLHGLRTSATLRLEQESCSSH